MSIDPAKESLLKTPVEQGSIALRPVSLRRAHVDDADAISALILGLKEFFTVRDEPSASEPFFNSLSPESIRDVLQDPEYSYWVAETESSEKTSLVGVGALKRPSHLFHLFVSRDGHGQGLGRRLWQRLMDEAGPEISTFTVNSSPYAVPVYRRLGFQPTGPQEEKNGISYVPMRLEVDKSQDAPVTEYKLVKVLKVSPHKGLYAVVSVSSKRRKPDEPSTSVDPDVFGWVETHPYPMSCEYLKSVRDGATLALQELNHLDTQIVVTEFKYLLVDITHIAAHLAGYQATYLHLTGEAKYASIDLDCVREYETKSGLEL